MRALAQLSAVHLVPLVSVCLLLHGLPAAFFGLFYLGLGLQAAHRAPCNLPFPPLLVILSNWLLFIQVCNVGPVVQLAPAWQAVVALGQTPRMSVDEWRETAPTISGPREADLKQQSAREGSGALGNVLLPPPLPPLCTRWGPMGRRLQASPNGIQPTSSSVAAANPLGCLARQRPRQPRQRGPPSLGRHGAP